MNDEKIRLFHLFKQNLIQKSNENYLELLDFHIGLHSTDYLTPYFSLWARIKNFEPEFLFNSLVKNKEALRMNAFRGTLFIIHKNNIALTLASLNKKREIWLKDAEKHASKDLNFNQLENEIISLFEKNKQMKNPEIKKALASKYKEIDITILLRTLALNGTIVRTTQKNITDKIYFYSLMKEWMPEIAQENIDTNVAVKTLFEKYLRIFAPVSLDDYCWWLPETKTTALDYLDDFLEKTVKIDYNGTDYYIHKNDYNNFQEFNTTDYNESIVNFLPYEDHFPKAYQKRDYFISDEVKENLFGVRGLDRGEIRPSIWLNGEVIGRWEYSWIDNKKTRMKIEIIYLNESKITKDITKIIEEKRSELELFTNEKLVPLIKRK